MAGFYSPFNQLLGVAVPVLDGYEPDVDELTSEQGQSHLVTMDESAEQAVLVAILTTPRVFDDVCDKLVSTDFAVPAHQAIYAAVVACDTSGRPFDAITVTDEMHRAGTVGLVHGGKYVHDLARAAVQVESLDAHVDIVLNKSLRRRMLEAARAVGSAAVNPSLSSTDALDIAEQHIFELGQERNEPSLSPLSQVLAKTQAQMAKARNSSIVGRSTGLARLDEVTGGLRGGQLIIVAARPSMGKSVLAMQLAAHIAEVEGLPVPFFSYEMQHEELGVRLLAARTGISMTDLNRGHIPAHANMDRAFASAVEDLGELPLLIDDRPPTTVTGLRSEVRRLARRGPLGAVVVDYLQLLEGDPTKRNENRTQEVSYISRVLKLLAVELDVPVIAVSQLSRASENRPNKRPMLSDLRESGSLEQDANVVLALYREWVHNRSIDPSHAEILVLKNRQGALDDFAVDFDGPCARFKTTSRELMPVGGFGGSGHGSGRDMF